MKKCPDCAEMVLGEARKCRYCSYRFGARHGPEKAGLGTTVAALLRRREPEMSPSELLAHWEIDLMPGETIGLFLLGRAAAGNGYLIVTNNRILFHELGSRHADGLRFECSLSRISRIHSERRGRRLRLIGDGHDDLVVGLEAADGGRAIEYVARMKGHRD